VAVKYLHTMNLLYTVYNIRQETDRMIGPGMLHNNSNLKHEHNHENKHWFQNTTVFLSNKHPYKLGCCF